MSASTDTFEVRIYYQDTDCGGVVYYGNFLRYFEQGRTHWLETKGLSVKAFMDEGVLFAVVHAELFYRSPARYGETLTIATTLKEMRAASFTFAHETREKPGGSLVVGSVVSMFIRALLHNAMEQQQAMEREDEDDDDDE